MHLELHRWRRYLGARQRRLVAELVVDVLVAYAGIEGLGLAHRRTHVPQQRGLEPGLGRRVVAEAVLALLAGVVGPALEHRRQPRAEAEVPHRGQTRRGV